MSNWDPDQYEDGLEVLLDKSELMVEKAHPSSSNILDKEEAEIKAFDNQRNMEGSKLDKPFLSPFQR